MIYHDLLKVKDEIIHKYVIDKMSSIEIALNMFNKRHYYNPILQILKENNISIRTPKELRPKWSLKVDNDYFKTVNSHEKAYWLGFLYADGCMKYQKGIPYGIAFRLKDRDPVENFKKATKSEHKLCDYNIYHKKFKQYYQTYSITITSKFFAQHLFNLGMVGQNNYNIDFPNIEEQYYSSFIRGLIDGDGCFSFRKSQDISRLAMHLIVTEKIGRFIQKFFITKFQFNETKLSTKYNKSTGNLVMFNVINRKDVYNLIEYLYKYSNYQTRLARKYDKAMLFKKWYENNEKTRIQYSFIKNGIIIKSPTIAALARQYNLERSSLSQLWSGKLKTHKGWVAYKEYKQIGSNDV